MLFIKKNIFLKTVFAALVLDLILLAIAFILTKFEYLAVDLKIISITIFSLTLGFIFIFHLYVTWPLKNIIKQIKLILTGKNYNHIYTKKIDEVGILAHFFNEITSSIEKASTDIKAQRRMSAELEIASKIQNEVFPPESPTIQNLTVITKTKPAAEIGGDSFDFIYTKENIFFYIGDVTGHGVPAGLVMMMINTLINTFSDLYSDTKQIIDKTNKYLKPLLRSIMFMTLILFRWHIPSQKLFFCGAGHNDMLIYKAKTKTCHFIKSGGIAVGMIADIEKYSTEQEIDFEQGDTIFLYTDGIVEYRNLSGEMFGKERLKKFIEKIGYLQTAEAAFNLITAEISQFTQGTIQEDDMSLIIIKRKEEILSENLQKNIHWQELIPDKKIGLSS